MVATKTKKRPATKAKGKKLFGSKSRPKKAPKPETNGHQPETNPAQDETIPPVNGTAQSAPEASAAVETPGGAPVTEPADEDQEDREIAASHARAAKVCSAADKAVPNLNAEDQTRLFSLYRRVAQSQNALTELTEERKSAKKRCDAATDELHQFLGQCDNGSPLPLIKHIEKATPNGEVTPTEDAWRQDPIDVLSDEAIVGGAALSEALLAKFRQAEILTIGDLVNYTDPTKNGGYQRNITDLDGIGKAAAEKISEATEAYWAWQAHRAPAPADVNGQAAPPADDSWKSLPVLDNLRGLPARVIEKLSGAGVNTLGELEAAGDLTHLPGIGKKVAAKIGAALAGFWERRAADPQPGEAATSAPSGEKVPCPHCKAEITEAEVLSCPNPGCERKGCASCMPGGPESVCPDCEAKEVEGNE